ncbi:MAG: dockerin type I domain-containing protein, partial [Planctomycetota bacterium]
YGPSQGALVALAAFDFVPPFNGQALPPSSDQTFFKFQFQLSGPLGEGACTTLDLMNQLKLPPIDNIVIIDGQSFSPILTDGDVCHPDDGKDLFVRGNSNNDATIDIADAIFTINYLFVDGADPSCLDAADANNDGTVDVSDVIYTIQWAFNEGRDFPEPFPNCGLDTGISAGCGSFAGC